MEIENGRGREIGNERDRRRRESEKEGRQNKRLKESREMERKTKGEG